MKYNVGDKLKPKKGYEEMCAIYRNNNGAYIVVTNISDYGSYHYDIYNKNDVKVEDCFGCFGDEHLEPIPEDKKTVENKFKVGDRVEIIDEEEVYDYYNEMAKKLEAKNWKEGRCPDLGAVGTVVNMAPHMHHSKGIVYLVRIDNEDFMFVEDGLKIIDKDDKKEFIVHCPTEELWRRVQEKMFSEGYEWVDGGKKYEDGWNYYKERSCISIIESRDYDMAYESKPYYEKEYPTIPIISAEKYLGKEKKKFIVHCPTEELCGRVQKKMFREGYEWLASGKKLQDHWQDCGEYSCISVGIDGENKMTLHRRPYYENEYPTIPIISASEYLGEETFKLNGDTYIYTGSDVIEHMRFVGSLDRWNEPITNSPIKEHKNPIMTGLKKVTNFIDSLQEPLRSYIRLGWVVLEDDRYLTTEEGDQAFMDIQFGIVKHKTLEAYAEAEVKRLEKEEKKK